MVSFKSKNKKVLIIIAAVILLGALLPAAVLFMSQKTARSVYLRAEGNYFKKCSEQVKKAYRNLYEENKPYLDGRHTRRTEFSVDIERLGDNSLGIANIQDIVDIIRRCKLIAVSNNDPEAFKSHTRLSLLIEKSPLIDAEAFTHERKLGFTIPVLLPNRYFIVNMDRFDEIYERYLPRYGIVPVKPKRVLKKADMVKELQYSDAELDSILNDYGSFFSAFIDEKDVQYGDKTELSMNGREVKGRNLTVVLDRQKAESLLENLAERVSRDDVLLKLTYGNYERMTGLIEEAGLFQLLGVLDDMGYIKLDQMAKEYVSGGNGKAGIEGFGKALKDFTSRIKFPEGISMELFIDKKGNILERKITIPLSYDGKTMGVYIQKGTNNIADTGFGNGFMHVELEQNGTGGERFVHTWKANSERTENVEGNSKAAKINIEYFVDKNGIREHLFEAKLDVEEKPDELTLKTEKVTRYDIRIQPKNSELIDKISGEMSSTRWENNKHNTRNIIMSLSINADLPSWRLRDMALKMNVAREDKFGIDDFALPEIRPESSIDLNAITEEELLDIEKEMAASFGMFYFNNKSLIDIFIGAD